MDQSKRNLFLAFPGVLTSTYMVAGAKDTLPSAFYPFDELPARSASDLIVRDILDGMIFEGCHISLHESDLAPHSRPHPPHRHRHEEMVFVVEGTLEFTV